MYGRHLTSKMMQTNTETQRKCINTVVDPVVDLRAAMNKVADTLTSFMRSMGVSEHLCMKSCDWDDPSRVAGSCWGDNITDVKLEMLKNDVWYPLHTMGSKNFDPVGVYVKLKDLNLTVADKYGEGQHTVDAFTVLNDLHAYFPHKVDAGTCLAIDADERVFYKVQVVFVPCNDDGKSEANVATKALNYQSGPNRPRNLVLYGWPEGCDVHTDDPEACGGQRLYCATEVSKADGESHRFLTTTDVSPRKVAESGTETKQQAEAALAAGKSIERKMGPVDADKHGGCIHMQVPIEQTELARSFFTPATMIGASMEDPISPAQPNAKKAKLGTWSSLEENEELPVFRSLTSDPDEESPAPERKAIDPADALPTDPAVNCKMGRTKKGPHYGVDRPLAFSNLKRDKAGGVITFTETMFVCINEDKEPTVEDATQVYKLMTKRILAAVKRGGETHNLKSDFAASLGHTTKCLSMNGAQGIAATITAVGKAGISDDLFA